ncbi:SNF2-related protein [Glutamicibacter uratoxydans]|uniref:SNF2-related protein n=1 Tax=Glutamicibacter uratoxydans TaxID=43667 RepID=UPI003D6EE1CF
MTNAVPPTLDSRLLLSRFGNGPFFYGQALAKDPEAVTGVEFAQDEGKLSGTVHKDGQSFQVELTLKDHGRGWNIEEFSCTCAAGVDCEHGAALAVAGNKIATRPRALAPAVAEQSSGWRRSVENWFEKIEPLGPVGLTKSVSAPVNPMALQFLLFDMKNQAQQQWLPSGTTQFLNRNQRFRLGVRPMVRGGDNRWVRGQLRWTTIAFKTFGWNLLHSQHHWFTRFAALARSNTQLQFKVDEDWLFLDSYASFLLWPMLAEAQQLGIEFLGTRSPVSIQLGSQASFDLRADRVEQELNIAGHMRMGEHHILVNEETAAGTIADHGYYLQLPDTEQIWLAPSDVTVPAQYTRWFLGRQTLQIPQSEEAEFFRDVYPRLARRFPVSSVSTEVQLPQLEPPYLAVDIHYTRDEQEKDLARVDFAIRYPGVRDDQLVHDEPAENELRNVLNTVLFERTGRENDGLETRYFPGDDLIDFVSDLLPALRALPQVRITETGSRPIYHKLSELPLLKINAVDSEKNDWLDLGLLVCVGQHEVPFATIMEALSNGAMKVKLPDNSWFSLDQPLFAKLKALVDEAQSLNDKPKNGDVQLSVFQVSLFEDFSDLAEGVNGADLFIARMRSLLNVADQPTPTIPRGLNAQLRPYQVDGFNWLSRLYRGGFGGILADDMGLGKTVQTIALMLHAHELWDADSSNPTTAERAPFLVVAPSSVVSNWEMEIRRFAPQLRVSSVAGTLDSAVALQDLAEQNDVLLTTYTLLRLNDQMYAETRFAGLILDEAQFVKNRSTKAHRAAIDIQAPFKLAVTGTPMENNLAELGSLLSLTTPSLFHGPTVFNRQFARPIETLGDREKLQLLHRRIKPFMLRRTKESVVLDLPAKQEQQVLVSLNDEHRHVYDTHLNRERQKILNLVEDMDRNRFTIFQSLTHLRMLALDPRLVDPALGHIPSSKLDALFEQLEDVISEGHRALIFSQFTSFLKVFAEQLTERGIAFEYLDGSTRNRSEVIASFKEGQSPLFLISLKAGGFGLNLTEADYCFLLDPWWNPAVEAQAIDRTHRIGQQNQVMVYRLISQGTIEEKVVALQESKRRLISTVMDGADGFAKALTAQDIRELLE